ncbi:hypothetical protein FACS189491_08330 [Spirochaetia bacterium]|nr:hypothetical protein FACS189491_08330 [Spirochaetia bacterium]
MKKKMVLIAVLLLSILIIGCNKQGAKSVTEALPGEGLTFGIAVTTLTGNPFNIALGNAAKEECERLGIKTFLQGAPDYTNFQGQVNILENYVAQKVDAILVTSIDADAVVPALDAAAAAKIPVVFFDHNANTRNRLTYIGTNNVTSSYEGVKMLLQKIGGKGQILHIEGAAGVPVTDLRKQGMLLALKEFPDVQLVMSQDGHYTAEGGMAVMESALQAFPNIDVVFCANDLEAQGAWEAAANVNKQDDIIIMGYDGDRGALEDIKAGKMDHTIVQYPEDMAIAAVRLALGYIKSFKGTKYFCDYENGNPYTDNFWTGFAIVSQENVDQFLK